ncbi:putative F-box domain-containing protein [Helianthus annuus]|nr:putative F-box domain-containing protein [Helianthus annuus]
MAANEEANIGIGDHDVIYNILSRLPGKPLLRFRRVSKHWNRLISDPYFMKLRSRRVILLTYTRPLVVIDENTYYVTRIRHHLQHTRVSIVGTFNGIVLLALYDYTCLEYCQLILYNPLTCASKKLVSMGEPYKPLDGYVFGFGYGATTDNLKIVRFDVFRHLKQEVFKYDVFDLKTSSWSKLPQYLTKDFIFTGDKVGRFLNGVLYWMIREPCYRILALNVKEMVFWKTKVPYELMHTWPLLGSIDGCLCMINSGIDVGRYDLWVSKDQGGVEISWLKAHSFTIRLEPHLRNNSFLFYILGNGKILIANTSSTLLVMYDMFKDSYKTIDLESCRGYGLHTILPIEYVESLVSPSDMC